MKWRLKSHDVTLQFDLVSCTFSVDLLGDGSLTASVVDRDLIFFTGSNLLTSYFDLILNLLRHVMTAFSKACHFRIF